MVRPISIAALAVAALLASCNAREADLVNDAAQNETAPAEPTGESPVENAATAPGAAGQANEAAPALPEEQVSPCLVQDGERIPANRIKAIGTEPFWGARIEGRCVTYSTPEDIDGTRVWTRFSGTTENGTWTGYFDDQHFVLRTRPQPGCSDGMSDKRYPIAVTLTVRGEERTGCAEPL